MTRNQRIITGIGIFLMFSIFTFTFSPDGLQFTWFDLTSGIIGLVVSTIIMFIFMKNMNPTSKSADALELRELQRHDVEGYSDEDFV